MHLARIMKRWIRKIKNQDFYGKVSQILNVYVLLLGILAVLVSIGVFPINDKPDITIIKAGYTLQMKNIMEISSNDSYNKILKLSPDFAALYMSGVDANAPIGAYLPEMKKESLKYLLPYRRVGFKSLEGWSNNTDENIFYRLGVVDSVPKHWIGQAISASKNRSDLQKIYGIHMLLIDQTLKELDSYSADKTQQSFGIQDFKFDPLKELYKIRNIAKDSVTYNNLVMDFSFATKVYSVLSIANPSDEDMSDIDLFINQMYNYGNLNIIGWTNLSSVDLNESDNPNIHINIRQIKSGESIEFVFYGRNILREQEVILSYPRFATINKTYVINLMVGIAVIVVVLFFIFGKLDALPDEEQKNKKPETVSDEQSQVGARL
jgi:hypothetical protein